MPVERPRIIQLPPVEKTVNTGQNETQPIQSPESYTKPSRMPDQKIAFVQRAFAAGADERLDDRLRLFMAHAVTKPYLILQELAPYAGVRSAERPRSLLDIGIRVLWEASPRELQQQYPLNILRRHRNTGVPISAERKARIGAAHKGKQYSPDTRAKISEARKGKYHTPATKALMSVGQLKAWERRKHTPGSIPAEWLISSDTKKRMSDAHTGKPLSAEHREAIRKGIERKKQQREKEKYNHAFPLTEK